MGRLLAAAVALPFVVGFAAAPESPEPRVESTFTDPEIVESSGLVARDGLLLTVNDSGDVGRVFAVSRRTGETVGVTTWDVEPYDVEALAPVGGPDAGEDVWVADIGDNAEARESVRVVRVPVGRGDRQVEPASYELVYPDGPRDAETLMAHPVTGQLVVVTKGVFGGDVMVAPRRLDPDRPNRMRIVGAARPIATDGAFWPDGAHLVVRGYGTATVYTWPGLRTVETFELPEQEQGEGVAVDASGHVLLSTEGVRTDVLRARLPRAVREAVEPVVEPTTDPTTIVSALPEDQPDGAPAGPSSDPAAEPVGSSGWTWLVGLGFGAVMLLVLLRSLRPRG